MKSLSLVIATLCFATPAAYAQSVPNGTHLNLAGAVPTLNIDASHPVIIGTGEPQTWPTALPPQPFTSPNMTLYLGLPGYGAQPSSNYTGTTKAYFSGWNGEAEIYPNADEDQVLQNSHVASPNQTTDGTIELVASAIPASVMATVNANMRAGRSLLSGAFNSYPYSQKYGYFEVTARVPKGNGLWPAFWLCPTALTTGEIDITEILSKDTFTTYATLHTGDAAWKQANPDALYSFPYKPGYDFSQGYHRYGLDWNAHTITFYVDDAAIESLPTPSDMKQPYYLMGNLAAGGGWAGPIDSTTPLPATYSIASIRVWQRPGYTD